jgi:DNA-binding response OmpR family regulator
MSARILVVDDEPAMRVGLQDNLELEGYTVDVAEDGLKGLALALANSYDLVVLDVMMPGMSGLDVCRRIRDRSGNTFILLLTAKGEEVDKVVGLELGADDYVTKPFSLRELLARIKAVLRRTPAASKSADVSIGKLVVNFGTYTATDPSGPVKMSQKEYAILDYLLRHRDEVITRDDLLKAVWGYEETPTTRTVDNFIVKLRQKVEDDPNSPRHILTVHGTGYKLVEF